MKELVNFSILVPALNYKSSCSCENSSQWKSSHNILHIFTAFYRKAEDLTWEASKYSQVHIKQSSGNLSIYVTYLWSLNFYLWVGADIKDTGQIRTEITTDI